MGKWTRNHRIAVWFLQGLLPSFDNPFVCKQKYSNVFVEKLNRFSDPNENALNFLAVMTLQAR